MEVKALMSFSSTVYGNIAEGDVKNISENYAYQWHKAGMVEILEGEPEEAPQNVAWRDLHWKKKIALAKEVSGEDVSNKDEAETILENHYG